MVALSLTESDDGLVRYASIATALGAFDEIRFVHVMESPHTDPSSAEKDRVRAQMSIQARASFDGLGAKAVFDVVHGPRLDQLLAAAVRNRCDVIILGHRRERSGSRSLARRLAMVAPCSVWLVPEGSPATIDSILVPVDYSAHSADAMSAAAALAAARGLKQCTALHVFFDPSTVRYPEHIEEIRRREQTHFDAFLEKTDRHGVEIVTAIEESTRPTEAIRRVAARIGSDLIVMNTRGRSRASAILLGSITSKAMEETTIPLLAVKHFGSRMSVLDALLHHRHWEEGSPKTN